VTAAATAMNRSAAEWSHPVAFFMNGIGDHILNLPALRALAHSTEGKLTVICAAHPASYVFDELPARIVRVKREPTGPQEFDWRAAGQAVEQCDLFVSLVPWSSLSLSLLKDALQPRLSVGFQVRLCQYDVSLPLDFTKHSARLAFDLVSLLSPALSFDDCLAPPRFRPAAAAGATRIKSELGHGVKLLTVHGETKPKKMWRPERLSAVLSAFLKQCPEYICVLLDRKDIGIRCDDVHDRVVEPFLDASDSIRGRQLPLDVMQCLVSEADLFLGVDSCFLHVADLCRVPTVALFGGTSAHEWGCLTARNHTVQGNGSMEHVLVPDVLDALLDLASERRVSPVPAYI
jgi:ADP-heptose:LPS heptosyltransferase